MSRKHQQDRTGKKSKKETDDEVVEEEDDDQSESDDSDERSNDGSSSESESDSDGEEEDVAASLFKGPNEESESDDDSAGEESMDDANASSSALQSEAYTYDLRNLLAINTDQLAIGSLYDSKGAKKSKSTNDKDIEIPLDPIRGASLEVNEEYLLSKATDGCTQLIRAIWELPTEQSDAGPLATLPAYDEVRLPRAMVCTFLPFSLSLCSKKYTCC
jgi:hypothetical protein